MQFPEHKRGDTMDSKRLKLPNTQTDNEQINYFTEIPQSRIEAYSASFMESVLAYIKNDDVLSHFYLRLICECENLKGVIDEVNQTEIMELEEIIDNLKSAANIELASQFDTAFHRRLFAITGKTEFFIWWHINSQSLHLFLVNLWKTIGYKSEQYEELVANHDLIFTSIKEKNHSKALTAMQQHFALVLFQLLGTMYQSTPEPDDQSRK